VRPNDCNDARVKVAGQVLTDDELRILRKLSQLAPNHLISLALPNLNQLSIPDQRGLDGLIAKQCIRSPGVAAGSGNMVYGLNEFGYALAAYVQESLEELHPVESDQSGAEREESPKTEP
jgi:hypothetical protein